MIQETAGSWDEGTWMTKQLIIFLLDFNAGRIYPY